MARRSKHTAYAALITRLQSITGGATYHTDLGSRVYPMLVLPEENASIHLPYACVPLIDVWDIEDGERATLDVPWEIQIHLFVADTASDPLQSKTSELAAKAADDLIKALKTDETLGGACQDLTLMGGATEAGAIGDGRMYAEVILRIKIKQTIGIDVLGP